VLLADASVAITGTAWPDVLMGLLITGFFLSAAWGVIRASLTEYRRFLRVRYTRLHLGVPTLRQGVVPQGPSGTWPSTSSR
jgi:hypothetical protein